MISWMENMEKTMNDYILQQRSNVTNRFYVYLHIRETDNSVYYVGKGCGARAWSTQARNSYWDSTTKKYGQRVEILFDNLEEQESLQCETDVIKELLYFGSRLCNMTSGGDNPVFNSETRNRMSIAGKGKAKSQQHRLALSNAKKGIPRLNIKGRLNPKADKNIYIFAHTETMDVFQGTRIQFSEEHNISLSRIRDLFVKNKRRWTADGWCLVRQDEDVVQCINNAKFRNTAEGKLETRFKDVIHHFKNIRTEESFTGTRLNFVKEFNVKPYSISSLFCIPPRYCAEGWILVDSEGVAINPPKGRAISPSYLFKNLDGSEHTATKVNMAKHLDISEARINDMFRTIPRPVRGWKVIKETNDNRTEKN